MAVPSSGELRLYADIGVELGVTQSDVSLGSMSDSAGFASPDAMSDFYGYVDALAPSVTTNAISSVGETTFRANGNVTSDGGATIIERGFYIGTNSSSPTNNTKYTVSGTTGTFLYNISGLSSSTTYYCWAFATNSVGTIYGGRVQATTIQAFTPNLVTPNASCQGYFTSNNNLNGVYGYHGIQMYYVNPYTGGLVATNGITYPSSAVGNTTNNFAVSVVNGVATNAVNKVYYSIVQYGVCDIKIHLASFYAGYPWSITNRSAQLAGSWAGNPYPTNLVVTQNNSSEIRSNTDPEVKTGYSAGNYIIHTFNIGS